MPTNRETFDLQDAMGNFAGDPEVMAEALGLYFAEGPTMLEEVCRAARDGDLEETARTAHRYRGSLALFSARPAMEAARRVEEHAKQGEAEEARRATDRLRQAAAALDAALEAAGRDLRS